jgi:hypothetical protein
MTPEALRSYAAGLPPETIVPVPAGLLVEILNGGRSELVADLTVAEVSKILDRSESTVRLWCHGDQIPGAYFYRNRVYRVPRAALEAFQAAERTRKRGSKRVSGDTAPADIGAWRDHKKAS